MKLVLGLCLLFGTLLHAQEAKVEVEEKPNAVRTFLSIVSKGQHEGVDEEGKKCVVEVQVGYQDKMIIVSTLSETKYVAKVLNSNSGFAYKAGKKEFIHTEKTVVDPNNNTSIQKTIRTALTDDGKIYVVVAYDLTQNTENMHYAQECIIK